MSQTDTSIQSWYAAARAPVEQQEERTADRRGDRSREQGAYVSKDEYISAGEIANRTTRRVEDALAEVTATIYDQIGNPVDSWAVVATLESRGWRDQDARDEFGRLDLFDLGEEIYRRCKKRARPEAARQKKEEKREYWKAAGRFFYQYGRGLFFASPMAGQIAAILLLGYSLWAWLYFSQAQATVIALGTLSSFLVTGGFVQAIGLKGTHHLSSGNGVLARKLCYRLVGLGLLVTAAAAAAVFLVNLLFPFYPPLLMGVSVGYFVLLSALWLFLSVLYVTERLLSILVITLVSLAPVHLVMTYTDWGIYAAHGLGLLLAVALAGGYGAFWMRRLAARTPAAAADYVPASTTAQAYEIAPFFGYGVLYFALLLVDRVMAWSAGGASLSPYAIWFRTGYELGMDWALVSLLLTLAFVQYAVHDFSDRLLPIQEGTSGLRSDALNRRFFRRYLRYLGVLVLVGVASAFCTHAAVEALEASRWSARADVLFSRGVTPFVFWWAVVGYLMLAVGLLNTFFFFTLSRPSFALRALAPAVATDLLVGFVLSRSLGHEYAVVGMVVGAFLFAALTTRSAWRLFRRFDYFYYSAY